MKVMLEEKENSGNETILDLIPCLQTIIYTVFWEHEAK